MKPLRVTTVIVLPPLKHDPKWLVARAEVGIEDAVTIRDILVAKNSEGNMRVVMPRLRDNNGTRRDVVYLETSLWKEVSRRILARFKEADELAASAGKGKSERS